MVQVHRFRDNVAISLPGSSETVYLSQTEAVKLAGTLRRCAKDVRAKPFGQSDFETWEKRLASPFDAREKIQR